MIKSICIMQGTLYYSNAWIGTLLAYLKADIEVCDQAQVIFNDDETACRIFGDGAIEKALYIIKDLVGKNVEIEFRKFSDKCIWLKVVGAPVNVIISSPHYEFIPFESEAI